MNTEAHKISCTEKPIPLALLTPSTQPLPRLDDMKQTSTTSIGCVALFATIGDALTPRLSKPTATTISEKENGSAERHC